MRHRGIIPGPVEQDFTLVFRERRTASFHEKKNRVKEVFFLDERRTASFPGLVGLKKVIIWELREDPGALLGGPCRGTALDPSAIFQKMSYVWSRDPKSPLKRCGLVRRLQNTRRNPDDRQPTLMGNLLVCRRPTGCAGDLGSRIGPGGK